MQIIECKLLMSPENWQKVDICIPKVNNKNKNRQHNSYWK